MSTQCDRCTTNLSWKFDARQNYLMTVRSTRGFSIPALYSAFKSVVQGFGVPVPESATVPIFNLCDACWARAADGWTEGGAAVYAGIPAKTADDGVYMRNGAPEYGPAESLDVDAVRCTIVHEMMHYLSKDHTGIQAYESGKPLHWDEAVTDFLARRTYLGCGGGTYKTNYGQLSDLVQQAANRYVTATIPFSGKALVQTAQQESQPAFNGPRTLPQSFRTAFSSLVNNRLTTAHAGLIQRDMQSWLITWHQQGAEVPIAGACNMKLDGFVASNIGKLLFAGFNDTGMKYGTSTVYTSI